MLHLRPLPVTLKAVMVCSPAREEAASPCCPVTGVLGSPSPLILLLALKETFLQTDTPGWKATAQPLASPMSRNPSSDDKDLNSESSQLPISQEHLGAIQGSFFRSQAIFYFTALLKQAVGTGSLQMSTGSVAERCCVSHSTIAC